MNLNEIRDNKNAIKDRKRIGRGIGSGLVKPQVRGTRAKRPDQASL